MTQTSGDVRTPQTYAALAAMCLIWGSTFLAIRIGTESVAPLWAAAIRLIIAAPIYFILARASGATMRGGRALRAAVGYGVFNYGVNFVCLYWGEQRIPSATAAVVYATIPLTTVVFAALLDVHPFDVRQLTASLIGVAGVTMVFSGELMNGAPAGPLAAVLVGATASSLSAVILKKGPPQSTWVVNAVGASAGAVICVAASVAIGESHAMPIGPGAWGPILYLVVAGNLGAYALYGWLIAKWNVVRVNVIALVIPIIAVVLGALVRNETLPATSYAGAAVVLVGVALALFSSPRPQRDRA